MMNFYYEHFEPEKWMQLKTTANQQYMQNITKMLHANKEDTKNTVLSKNSNSYWAQEKEPIIQTLIGYKKKSHQST